MKYNLTNQQINNLKSAVNKAENPGSCKYTLGCVIGKLWEIESGQPIGNFLKFIENSVYNKPSDEVAICHLPSLPRCLQQYPIDILTNLQELWDDYTLDEYRIDMTVKEYKNSLVQKIDKWANGEEVCV